eukprot:m.133320 g.133320  ORF g.133320 m.133320 type:complete len:279 (+) comp29668_c0_seq1:84-920(+)
MSSTNTASSSSRNISSNSNRGSNTNHTNSHATNDGSINSNVRTTHETRVGSTTATSKGGQHCNKGLVLIGSGNPVTAHREVISELRHEMANASLELSVTTGAGDFFVLSCRLGVDVWSQRSLGEARAATRAQKLSQLFARPYVIVQRHEGFVLEASGPSIRKYESMVLSLARFNINLLFSDSASDTAKLIEGLASDELKKGFGVAPPKKPVNLQWVNVLMSIPGINYGIAMCLCTSTSTLSFTGLVNSTAKQLEQLVPGLNSKKAEQICWFFKSSAKR